MATTVNNQETTVAAEILDTVLSQVHGAEQDHVELNLRNTIREFLQKSKAWRDDLTITAKADRERYYLNPVDQWSMVAAVLNVFLDGNRVSPVGDQARDVWYNFRYTDTGTGNASGRYIVHQNKELVISPAPAADGQLVVGVSLQILPSKTAVPDFIGQQYFDAIVCGTLARLHGEHAKPYSSIERSQLERKQFLSEVKRARDIANRYYTTGSSGWRFPYFASGGHR